MKPELLLPAGSVKSLERAVMCGADAVYLGLKRFNARANADNFDTLNIKKHVDYCHLYGVRVYVAFNISIKENEIKDAERDICAIADSGADGIIVTDIGLIPIISDFAPELPIHISTQAGVCNLHGAEFFERLGADRVVLARETGKSDMEAIRDNSAVDMEYFVQGALCVSFSGGCLMSSAIHGKSGNRGECLQPCRQLYGVDTGSARRNGYMLSTSDLCLIDKLKELQGFGIKSFKVEGRLRRPEYAAQAALSYRRVLYGISDKSREISGLKRAYNRGEYSEGYIFSDNGELMSPEVQGHIGEAAGRVIKVYMKGGFPYAEVISNIPLGKGDGLKILRNEREAGGADLHSVENKGGGRYIIPVSSGVQAGDQIQLTTDASLNEELNALEKKLDLSIRLIARVGKTLKAEIRSGSTIISAEEDFIVPSAEKSPTTSSEIREQLSRLNDTEFSLSELKIEADKDIFLPKSRLNSLRRLGIEKLKANILEEYRRSERKNKQQIVYPALNPLRNSGRAVIASFASAEELKGVSGITALIYSPENYIEQGLSEFINAAEKSEIKKVYLALPKLIRQEDMPLLERLSVILKERDMGIAADNYGAVQYARDKGLPYIAGIGLNVYNLGAMALLADADYIFASPELSERDVAPLLDEGALLFGYGRLPLMHLAHCPIQLAGGGDCASCGYTGEFTYSDGKAVFPARRSKLNNCTFTLYNSLPHNLSGMQGIKEKSVYLDLKGTLETERQKIIDCFFKGVKYIGEKSTLGGYGR